MSRSSRARGALSAPLRPAFVRLLVVNPFGRVWLRHEWGLALRAPLTQPVLTTAVMPGAEIEPTAVLNASSVVSGVIASIRSTSTRALCSSAATDGRSASQAAALAASLAAALAAALAASLAAALAAAQAAAQAASQAAALAASQAAAQAASQAAALAAAQAAAQAAALAASQAAALAAALAAAQAASQAAALAASLAAALAAALASTSAALADFTRSAEMSGWRARSASACGCRAGDSANHVGACTRASQSIARSLRRRSTAFVLLDPTRRGTNGASSAVRRSSV